MDLRQDQQRVRTAELAAAPCLATDLGMGLPPEHGLRSTLVAMRVADRLCLDAATRRQVYYVNLLFHGGCTVDAEPRPQMVTRGRADETP